MFHFFRLLVFIGAVSAVFSVSISAQPDLSEVSGQTAVSVESGSAVLQPSLVIGVMDPLSKQLSCECIQGKGQKDYDEFAKFLTRELGCEVKCVYSESLERIYDQIGKNEKLLMVMGKDSIIRADQKAINMAGRNNMNKDKTDDSSSCEAKKLLCIAGLTNKTGVTTFQGLFVVPTEDPAEKLEDLKGYKVLFGLPSAEEKYQAAILALETAGVRVPEEKGRTCIPSCTTTALALLEKEPLDPQVGVISDYAQILLEGCETIPVGALRILAKTAPVRFISVFIPADLDKSLQQQLSEALLRVKSDKKMLQALFSRDGFIFQDPEEVK